MWLERCPRHVKATSSLGSQAAREGSDGPAFTELAARFREVVWRICYRIMGHSEDAADAAQDVLVRMFLQRDRSRGRSRYSTRVHGITVRTRLSLRRSRDRRHRRVSVLPEFDLDTAGHGTGDQEPTQRLDLDRMLDSLTDDDRAMVMMKYAEGHSYEELSEIFGFTESACQIRVSREVGRLREKYTR